MLKAWKLTSPVKILSWKSCQINVSIGLKVHLQEKVVNYQIKYKQKETRPPDGHYYLMVIVQGGRHIPDEAAAWKAQHLESPLPAHGKCFLAGRGTLDFRTTLNWFIWESTIGGDCDK